MALEITHLVKEADADHVEATERLCLTEDRERLVPETDSEARWLFCTPGHRITKTDAERYGLLKAKPKPQDKSVRSPQGDKAPRTRKDADTSGDG